MATLDKLDGEIAELKAEIAGYVADLKKDITPAEKSELRGLINTRSQTLNLLLGDKARRDAAGISS
jgi:hypothetical protein